MRKRLLTIGAVAVFLVALVLVATAKSGSASDLSPVASFKYSPSAPMPGDIVTFDASASYGRGGTVARYSWDFGDGTVADSATPITTHSYLVDGTYTVQLTVTDNNGAQGTAVAVIEVSTVVFFRVVIYGTLIPLAGAKVTVYYNATGTWVPAPVGPNAVEVKYDNMTQSPPHLANTAAERFRNPGFTASVIWKSASNIGFDLHQQCWSVFFKFEWGPWTAYWPNETTRVYTYKNGAVETHDYLLGHQAYWDPRASTYVTRVSDIPGNGVSPTDSHPIIVGIFCPPQPQQYYLTVKTDPSTIPTIPGQGWYSQGTNVALTALNYVSISTDTRCRFNYWDVDGASQVVGVNPIIVNMNTNHTATAHYVLQYSVVFNQAGLSSDATGTVATVNGTAISLGDMPFTYWVDNGSCATYSYSSIVSSSAAGKQYRLDAVTGPSSPIIVTCPSTVCGSYVIEYLVNCITFDQTGISSDFTNAVVEVDNMPYNVSALPVSFTWQIGSVHNFTFHSPLVVGPILKQYVWTSTDGLSTSQNGSITVTTYGSVVAHYGTEYYLTLTANPLGVASPFGAGWYEANANATVSTTGFVDIVLGCSRYRFNGWTTGNMAEIAEPARSPTTVLMDQAKVVTANYVAQYVLVFKQYGVGSDFTGAVAAIDTIDYNVTSLPATFWWDNGTTHSFDFKSPLIVTLNGKQYVWTSTTGESTQQGNMIVVTGCGNTTGSYRTQYCLTVSTSPPGITTIPGEGWYNESTSAVLTAPTVTGYQFARWVVNGVPQGPSVNPITLTMNAAQNATAQYTPITPYTLTVTTTSGGSTNPPPSIYTYSSGTTVQVTALPSSGYVLDHWEFDGSNVSAALNPYTVTMNTNHSLKAVFSPAPPPPSVTISPPDSTIAPGGSASFKSVVSGGTAPYTYQWYLDGAPVLGATSGSWTFTPASTGSYFVYLKVTDANGNTGYSNNARVTVASIPVGGYSVSLVKHESFAQMAAYTSLISLLAAALIVAKRKRK